MPADFDPSLSDCTNADGLSAQSGPSPDEALEQAIRT
jgi:hypothetical protein